MRKINVGNRQEAVINAAYHWFRTRRPVGWSLTKHLGNMRINTTTEAEAHLAIAVANLIIDRQIRRTLPNRAGRTLAEKQP